MPEEVSDNVQRPAFSGRLMLVFYAAMLLFAAHAATHMVGAGDTWVAMACGRHFINHGVNTVEPFSANSRPPGPTEEELAKYPRWLRPVIATLLPEGWIDQNWLTQVIFYWLKQRFGYNSLVVWKLAVCLASVFCIFYTGKLLGANPALSALFAAFAMFISRTFIDIRPQVFTNLIVAVFFLILVLTTYRNVLYIWLVVPLVVFWCNIHGGYIYAFIMLPVFVFFHLLGVLFRHRLVTIGRRGIVHTVAATLVAFVAMIALNPYHLTNLTHTYVISVSKHARFWRTVAEWHPAFEWDNPIGDEIPFLFMFIIMLVAAPLWLIVLFLKAGPPARKERKVSERSSRPFQWPKIDLALIVIAGMTIFMAVKSRRFIPIAAYVTCPLLAMMIDQTVRVISVRRNVRRGRGLTVSAMPLRVQKGLALMTLAGVAGFGAWCGIRFHQAYLQPWPLYPKSSSIFMRMTYSEGINFDGNQFIRDNKLKGNMFNYWTRGGLIAYGQEPDPETGEIPLKLFMDGRAQAAYNVDAYYLWSQIIEGGPLAEQLRLSRRRPTLAQFRQISDWVDQQLKKHQVWVVLMPVGQLGNMLCTVLESRPNWRAGYISSSQKMYIDISTEPGRRLFQAVMQDRAVFANEAWRLLTKGSNLLRHRQQQARQQGLELAIRSFELCPSGLAMREILRADRYPALRERLQQFCKKWLADFETNLQRYRLQDAYIEKCRAAMGAANYLKAYYARKKQMDMAGTYQQLFDELRKDYERVSRRARW